MTALRLAPSQFPDGEGKKAGRGFGYIHPVRLRLPPRNEKPPRPADTPPANSAEDKSRRDGTFIE